MNAKLLVALFVALSLLSPSLYADDDDDEVIMLRAGKLARYVVKVTPEEYSTLQDSLFRLEIKLDDLKFAIKGATEDSSALATLFEHDKSLLNLGRNHWYLRKGVRDELKQVTEEITKSLEKHNYNEYVHVYISTLRNELCGSMAVDWLNSQPDESLPKALVKLDKTVKDVLEKTEGLRLIIRKDTGNYSCLSLRELEHLHKLMKWTSNYLADVVLPIVKTDCKNSLAGKTAFKSVSHSRKGLAIGWRLSNPHFDKLKSVQEKGRTVSAFAENAGYPRAYGFWGGLDDILSLIKMDNFGPKANMGAEAALELRQHVESLIKKFDQEIETIEKDEPMMSLFTMVSKLDEKENVQTMGEDASDDDHLGLLDVKEDKTIQTNTIVDGTDIEEVPEVGKVDGVMPANTEELKEIAQRLQQMFLDAGWKKEEIPSTLSSDALYQALLRANSGKSEEKDADFEIFQPLFPNLPKEKEATGTL